MPTKTTDGNESAPNRLNRDLGIFDATTLGLGSIVGTGVFVSIALAASISGAWVPLAIFLASIVAICNGISSAQLAAAHPVSGGTYEYASRWLHPDVGFAAGWLFLIAKSASAATAAIGLSDYLLPPITSGGTEAMASTAISVAAVVVLAGIACRGVKHSARFNSVVVLVAIGTLTVFVICGCLNFFWSDGESTGRRLLVNSDPVGFRTHHLLEATALMFVAYTGYGRIATLGEEVSNPRRTIPLAIIVTLLASMVLYVSVASVSIATVAPSDWMATVQNGKGALSWVAEKWPFPWLPGLVLVGAVAGMIGVLFNLILGLSRVVLAMGRRGDVPDLFASVSDITAVPIAATWLCAGGVIVLVLLGDIKATWSLSAFTVLIYYGLTNLCAIRLEAEHRMFPVAISYTGFIACVGLAFCLTASTLIGGSLTIVLGILVRGFYRKMKN